MHLSTLITAGLLAGVCGFGLPADARATVTIMPMGDSITEGSGGAFQVYRYPLMEKLLAAGYDVAYVGGKTTHPRKDSPLGELRHEGYGGQNIRFLRNRFDELYANNPADILLLHAGHNQFAEQRPVPGMIADTRIIIEKARAINPRVAVLVAQVIPSGKLPKYSYIPDYNAALAGLVAELNTSAQPVILVDQATGFDWETDTVGDKVHPNARGAEKMASRWFEALGRVLPPPSARPSAPGSPDAHTAPAPFSLRLWEGDAPGLPEGVGPEVAEAGGRVSNVSVPMLDVYLPDHDKANGAAIIIVSGGGYGRLASGPLGRGAAKVFGPMGYAVFSLKYRTSGASKDILADATADGAQALRLVRAHAAEWGIDPRRVGMVGFSAGANLILNLATNAGSDARPDFVGLAATWPHRQTIASFTIDGRVPPAFVLHARDDASARFTFAEEIVAAWRAAGVPVGFHPRDAGGHMAFNSFRTGADQWPAMLDAWLRGLGFAG